MITINDKTGSVILSLNPGVDSIRRCELMKEDYILLKFSLDEPMVFPLGCYADTEYGLFEVCKEQLPTYNKSTGGYDYELKLDAHYWKWNNKIFKYSPETGGNEASWSLTASLDVHASIVLNNLESLGYRYRGVSYTFDIDSSVEDKAKAITYDNTYILDALFSMANEWDCECWITDSVIHFGRCEFGTPVDFKFGENVVDMSRSESSSTYATRLYVFGSDRNLPKNYRQPEEQSVINGVVQKRLMLPVGTPYIDAYEGMTQEDAIEAVIVLDDIYPKTDGNISSVSTYESTVENEDGTTTTETFYRFTDNTINFSEDYIIKGEELHVIFQSGTLNGMEFAVKFNPNGESEKLEDGSWNPNAQLWEIVANEDYGRKLPDSALNPSVGDKYVLTGWDSTKIAGLGLIDAAEQQLLAEGKKYIEKTKIDPNTYTCTLFSDFAYNNGNLITYELGDKVNLINAAYFTTSRESRIIGFEFKIDYPYDSPQYIVGESSSYSRLADIEGKIETLTLKGQTYTGGGGGVYLIRVNDNTVPTDSNAFSAKRSLKTFLRKDQDDRTEHSLGVGGKLTVDDEATFGSKVTSKMAHIVGGLLSAIGGLLVRGFIKIGDFMSGLQGGYIDEQGNAELESLILRSYLAVPELRYNRITYFEGYNLISPGGGLTIDDYVINEDGSITVTPRLEEGEPCGQFVGDILLGYYHEKTATGDFAGFMKVQFRVSSVDYDAKTFVMWPRDGQEYKIAKNMKLGQTGNFTNTERQTYIVIDTRYGNNCITLYDGVNTWTPTAAMAKAWFGKKKGVDIHGIDASNYSAVLQNIIMTGKIYQVDQISGQDIPVPIDKGAWASGQRYAYYDRVTYNGSLWLCVNENGTITEPSAAESSWLEQVAAGKGITSYAHWSTSICPVPANTILTFAQRLWISVRETSEPPLGCVTSQGAYVTYKDSEGNTGYVLRNPQTQSEDWVLLLDVSEMKDGDSIQVQYSADTISWHTTFTEGDLYMRQRVGETSWSAAMRIVGESGQEGRHTEYQFTKNKSEYTQPTTGWQDAPPSLAEGEYLWMRTGVVIPPATAPATWAVVRLSGEKGDAGVGVSDVKEYYLASASASGVTTSTSGWTETPQSVSESKPYLWNYETISYTDSKTVTIDPHIIGRWGANGKNGVGIASVVNQYAKSNSGTTEPVVWYSTPPAIDSTSRFLWNKETITYTDGSHIDVPAHVIGVYGEKGADGADGMGITNYGHWSSSLGTLPALSMVTMGGKSWLSKVSTANPPMGTVMSGGKRVKTKDASGQSVYVLSGLVNTTEWELVTESGRVFTLVPTVGSVVQTKLGFLSPSAFLVNVNQTVGSVSMPYTKGWVVARAMDYNGAMVQVVSASQTSQISITAYGSYTQYVVRLYSSYSNARNWQGDFIAEATIPVVSDGVDGKDGKDGRAGSEPRPRGQWVSGNTYVYNEKFRDIVVYNGHIYRVRSYGASVTAAPTGSDSDTNWEGADEMKFVATDLLLAQDVYTDKLTVTKVNAKSADGTTTCTIEGNTGKLKAKKAEFDGVTSKNMTATNMTVDGITATNANISGKITATSGSMSGMTADNITATNMSADGFKAVNADVSGKITASTGSIGNLTILESGSMIGGNLNIENASFGGWNISGSWINNIIRNHINSSRVFALAFGTGTVTGTYTVYLPQYSDIKINGFNMIYSYSFELNLFVPTKFCWNTEGIGYIAPITANNATYRITPSSGSTLYDQNGSAVDYYDLTKGDFIKLLGLFIRESSTSTPYIDYYVISLRR